MGGRVVEGTGLEKRTPMFFVAFADTARIVLLLISGLSADRAQKA
jgi:hypothetical protein